jgi:ATP-dependent helicase HepA
MSALSLPYKFAFIRGYGTGRIVSVNEDRSATVAFLDVPGKAPVEISVAMVTPTELLNNTRVWIEPGKDSLHWRAGRVGAPRNADGTYYILLPNSVTCVIAEDRIWTRWEREPSDLFAMLRNLTTESPHLYINRLGAMRALVSQTSRTAGLKGLWSSLVELHEHQLEAARRVLSDPHPRYLLADEVGLGKTIEAGLVIRQHLSDDTHARVLLLTPSHLMRQWQDELRTKFQVSDFGKDRVSIASHDEFVGCGTDYSLVVVDEVHRLSRHPATASPKETAVYAHLRAVCHASPRLLLLTATPVRAQGTDYLAILHLLSPDSHPIDDIEGFERKMAMRSDISEMLLGFDEDMPLGFIENYVDYFRNAITDDLELNRMLDTLIALAEEGGQVAPAIQTVRSHIAHRYRLHSRMIRNRRSGRLLERFPVRGRKLVHTVHVENDCQQTLEAHSAVRSFAADLDEMSPATLIALREVFSFLQTGHWSSKESRDHATHHLGSSLVYLCERAAQNDDTAAKRIAATIDFCEQLRTPKGGQHNGPKVFFCSSPSFADSLGQALGAKWGPAKVHRLTSQPNHEHNRKLIDSFRSQPGNAFLICDGTIEEGVNLQFSDLVILIDLPMTSGSLEQRIGRFDRFSLKIEPVDLIAVISEDPVETLWFGYLKTTGIFDQSVANLQYALNGRDESLLKRWLTLGHASAQEIVESTRDALIVERREIAKQDALDASEQSDEVGPFIKSLALADRELPVAGRSILAWASDLGFRARGARNENPRIFDGVARLSMPQSAGLLMNATVAHRLHPELWEDDLCVDRAAAIDIPGSRLLGVGNPVVDAIFDFARSDEKGRVCARQLTHPRLPSDSLYVVADLHFLIEPDLERAEEIANDLKLDIQGLKAQCRQWFSTVMVSCYLNASGEEVPESVRQVIDSPYARDSPYDINLGGSGYERFVSLAGDMKWVDYCRLIEDRSRELCSKDPDVANAMNSALGAARDHFHSSRIVLDSRIQAGLELPGSLVAMEELEIRVLEMLRSPKTTLDCVRVTFLKGLPR